jgi:hypothetical protein
MFKRVLLLVCLVAVLVVPGAAADMYFNYDDLPLSVTYEHQNVVTDTKTINADFSGNAGSTRTGSLGIVLKAVENYPELNYVYLEHRYKSTAGDAKKCYQEIPTGEFIGTYTRPSDNSIQPITVYVDRYYNTLGAETRIRILAFPQNWAIGTKTGVFYSPLTFNETTYSFTKTRPHFSYVYGSPVSLSTSLSGGIVFKGGSGAGLSYCLGYTGSADIGVVGLNSVKNVINIIDKNGMMEVSVVRQFDGKYYASEVGVYNKDDALITFNNDVVDVVLGRFSPDIFGKVTTKVPSLPEFNYTLIYDSTGADPTAVQPCTINVYDADTRLPLSGDWDYYVVVSGADSVSGSASGASAVVNLPVTSILQPHLLRVTKEGYEQTAPLAFDVPAGGREVNVYLTPSETTAPEGSSVVTFVVTDIETGTPRGQCLVNVDGVGKYAGASGSVWFVLPENSTHQWLVTAEGYWPIGGEFTLGVDDLVIPVEMTKKTSELPRPPMPGIPGLPVIHPSLDPAGFRMQILSVPILGDLASPLLDTVDSLGVGLDDIATAVLDFMTAPADQITGAVSSVSQNLIDTATPYLATSSLLLQVIGAAVSCLPAQVTGLVTFGLVLDIVRILLWGPA